MIQTATSYLHSVPCLLSTVSRGFCGNHAGMETNVAGLPQDVKRDVETKMHFTVTLLLLCYAFSGTLHSTALAFVL